MCMCGKCSKFVGALVLIAGILFLLADLGVWNWGLNWWTVAFILAGIAALGKSCCKDCMTGCCSVEAAAPVVKAPMKKR